MEAISHERLLKLAVAAAAVLIVAVVGYNLLPGSSTGVGGPGATPSPSATPTATPTLSSPSASVVFPPWFTAQGDGAGILPAGSQTTRRFVRRLDVYRPGGLGQRVR